MRCSSEAASSAISCGAALRCGRRRWECDQDWRGDQDEGGQAHTEQKSQRAVFHRHRRSRVDIFAGVGQRNHHKHRNPRRDRRIGQRGFGYHQHRDRQQPEQDAGKPHRIPPFHAYDERDPEGHQRRQREHDGDDPGRYMRRGPVRHGVGKRGAEQASDEIEHEVAPREWQRRTHQHQPRQQYHREDHDLPEQQG